MPSRPRRDSCSITCWWVRKQNRSGSGRTRLITSSPVFYADGGVVEPRTVVKYAAGAYISSGWPVECRTSPGHQAIFTAKDDDTVGEQISGSTGVPAGYYAEGALCLETAGSVLHDL